MPRQGVIYGSLNLQTGLMLARLLARQGDNSLVQFETREGLNGSQSTADAPAKSLALVAQTYLRLSKRELPWYQYEAHKTTQAPREATHLGRMELSYLGSGAAVDDFHELTMLASAAAVPAVPVAAVLMRVPAATSQRWPGAQGQRVSTGLGEWTDAFGILPAAYLLRP